MREPKWTEQQQNERLRSMLESNFSMPLSDEDRDELLFCGEYYSNTPEAKAARAEWAKRSAAEAAILDQQCLQIARDCVTAGQTTILRCLDDPQTHPWLKFYVVASHQYGRLVIDRVLAGSDIDDVWPMLWHPKVTRTDLERLIVDERCSEYLRGEIAARLTSLESSRAIA